VSDAPPQPHDRCPGCAQNSDVEYLIHLRERGWYITIDGCRSCREYHVGPLAYCPDCGTALPVDS
jgi:hypothetical protein